MDALLLQQWRLRAEANNGASGRGRGSGWRGALRSCETGDCESFPVLSAVAFGALGTTVRRTSTEDGAARRSRGKAVNDAS